MRRSRQRALRRVAQLGGSGVRTGSSHRKSSYSSVLRLRPIFYRIPQRLNSASRAPRFQSLIKIGHPSETKGATGFLVGNFNCMHHQLGRAADDAGFRQDVTIGGRSDMASVDLNSDWNKSSQIDLPAGVETGCGFCEDHADPAVQQGEGWRARSDIGIRRRSPSASAEMISTPRASGAVFESKARSCSTEVIRVKTEDIREISVWRSTVNVWRLAATVRRSAEG